jgi:hypothetical protein
MSLVNVKLSCKDCAREFVRGVLDEIVRAAKEGGISLAGKETGPLREI